MVYTNYMRFLRRLLTTAVAFVMIAMVNSGASFVLAATLGSMSVGLSDNTPGQTGVDYSVHFTLATTSNLKQVDFQFATTSGGSTKPASLALGSSTLGSITNLGAGWNLDTSAAASGLVTINRASASSESSGQAAVVVLHNVTNPALADCNAGTITLTDICYVGVTTYSDNGITSVDSGDVGFKIEEEPSLSFEVFGVASGQTHNGFTSSVTSTPTALAFGRFVPGQVKYLTQELVISTNAPHGYTVNAYLSNNIVGYGGGSIISPFAGSSASWSSPQVWSTPDGTTAGSDTGWIGANTSDSRVPNWSGGSGKLGPISGSAHPVAESSGPDRSGSTIYVTYALGINSAQPADNYSGTIVYDVQTSY